jgi:UDP-N-acetyl-2-amino-2-deoxyglucuronate dehydrogenase
VGTVCVCLPHHLHFPVAMAAVRAGLNVLVEKPLAVSLERAQQMVDAALETMRLLDRIYRTAVVLQA